MFPRHRLQSGDYLEIGKMCFLPEMNGNQCFGSRVLSQLVKWLKINTDCLFLYTLADGIMGEMRLCVSGRELPVYREFSHQRLPLYGHRGENPPTERKALTGRKRRP